jgi:uncharacterized protein (DUF2344 family)
MQNIISLDLQIHMQDNMRKIIQKIESDNSVWDNWTKSDKRFQLFCFLQVIEGDFDKETGRVTHYLDVKIGADDKDILEKAWKTNFILDHYATTKWHFIVDVQEKKVVKVLSYCV